MMLAAMLLSISIAGGASESVDLPAPSARNDGILALAGGVGLGLVSVAAFTVGFDAEREMRAGPHTRFEGDALLVERSAAAWVAWPAAVLSVASVGLGAYLFNVELIERDAQ